jgi:hypothetical protein
MLKLSSHGEMILCGFNPGPCAACRVGKWNSEFTKLSWKGRMDLSNYRKRSKKGTIDHARVWGDSMVTKRSKANEPSENTATKDQKDAAKSYQTRSGRNTRKPAYLRDDLILDENEFKQEIK